MLIEQFCHLPIYTIQSSVVAILAQRVSLLHRIIIALDGLGSLLHVTVDAAEQVMGFELLVGGAVVVVVIDNLLEEGVGRHLLVELVHGFGLEQEVAHSGLLRLLGDGAVCLTQPPVGGIGMLLHHGLGTVEQSQHCLVIHAGGQAQEQQEGDVKDVLHFNVERLYGCTIFAKVVKIPETTKFGMDK
ncbi:MAG: hypothetical protein IJP82_05590 [Bacteroidaceae bacterium]|nr:hypothetical protein [Bacteroidaceae bacterium]